MLCSAKTIQGYKLDCRDGVIGKAQEFYFDDKHWTIRYLVANTGNWLTGRQVLISPYALVAVNEAEENIEISLTKKQIEKSPSLNTDKPVSRQFEEDFFGYYEWPVYWSGPNQWGYLPRLSRNRNEWDKPTSTEKAWDPHLRSTHEVNGYHIQASDGEIGHVEDFIIDDDSWAIRYLVISTHNWLPGKKVFTAPTGRGCSCTPSSLRTKIISASSGEIFSFYEPFPRPMRHRACAPPFFITILGYRLRGISIPNARNGFIRIP